MTTKFKFVTLAKRSECVDGMSQLRELKGMTTIRFRPHCGEVCITDAFFTSVYLKLLA